MADAAVQFLIENLQQLVTYHSKLITDVKKEVEQIRTDLHLFRRFLKDTDKKRRTENNLVELVRQMREVVYETEDVIDSFVIQDAQSKWKNCFKNSLKDTSNLQRVAVKVARLRSLVEKIYGGKSRLEFVAEMSDGYNGDERVEVPFVREENIVGFEEDKEKLKSCINEQTQKLDIIPIIGMAGIGKTTLARMIYRDPMIQSNFQTRMWVYVSQDFNLKDAFKSILKQLGSNMDDEMYHKTDQELAKEITTCLEGRKFLVVLDDVWNTSDWDKLRIALPRNNNMGKVLLTSRITELALYANRNRLPHRLRFLTEDESWLLLKYQVFGRPVCPSELEPIGRSIAKESNGLPLAINVIAGTLVWELSASAWTKVLHSVYMMKEPERRIEKIIDLSYNSLPYGLRPCFLYLGMFPKDFEIRASKLIQLWIAEGFIIPVKDSTSLEETAQQYLEELTYRNLVTIDKMRIDGKVKTFGIHDVIRDFCITKARGEREMHEITRSYDGRLEPSVDNIKTYRRICMHSNVMDLFASKPFGSTRVRSFACYSKEDLTLPEDSVSTMPKAFKLLRVWEAKSLKFEKIPNGIYRLIFLRHIHLSLDNLRVLPRSFSKLWNIRTLLVDTTSHALEIKADIWKLMHLTHVKTNTSTTLPKPGKTSSEGANLQTLGTISPKSCTSEVFDRAQNLKKLSIRGKLTTLLHGKVDSLGRLENLKNLKLTNVFSIEGSICSLPPPNKFPPTLRSLTLSATYLGWAHMSALGKLENLAVLKLKDNAFMGKKWVTTDGGFWNLEILVIECTDLVVWEASAHDFPSLRSLKLKDCPGIEAIPAEFAELPSLQLLDLYHAGQAVHSAKKIRDAKGKSGFKLVVYPLNDPCLI